MLLGSRARCGGLGTVFRRGYQPIDLSLMFEVFGPIGPTLLGVLPRSPDAGNCIHHRLKVPGHLHYLILGEAVSLVHLNAFPRSCIAPKSATQGCVAVGDKVGYTRYTASQESPSAHASVRAISLDDGARSVRLWQWTQAAWT